MAIAASARTGRVVHKPDVQNKWDDNTHTHSDPPPIEHVTWYVVRLPHLTLPPINAINAVNNTVTQPMTRLKTTTTSWWRYPHISA